MQTVETAQPKPLVKVAASDINLGLRRGVVVLESDNFDNLLSLEASTLATIQAAREGLLGAAIKNRSSVYSVNADGTPITDITSGFPPGGKFRMDYEMGSTL